MKLPVSSFLIPFSSLCVTDVSQTQRQKGMNEVNGKTHKGKGDEGFLIARAEFVGGQNKSIFPRPAVVCQSLLVETTQDGDLLRESQPQERILRQPVKAVAPSARQIPQSAKSQTQTIHYMHKPTPATRYKPPIHKAESKPPSQKNNDSDPKPDAFPRLAPRPKSQSQQGPPVPP